MNDERMKNEKIARYFYDNQIKAHLSLKSGLFYNGIIKELGYEFFVFEDKEDGAMVIFYSELVKPIEEFKEDSS